MLAKQESSRSSRSRASSERLFSASSAVKGDTAVNCPKNAYFCRSGGERARKEPQKIEVKYMT